jgi:hypothetical protein
MVTAYSRVSHPSIRLSNDSEPVLGVAAFLPFGRPRSCLVAVVSVLLTIAAAVVIQVNSGAAVRIGTHVVGIDELIADRLRSVVKVDEARHLTWKPAEERPWIGYGVTMNDPSREAPLQETSHRTVLQSLLWFGGLAAAEWLALTLIVRVQHRRLRGVPAQGRDAIVSGIMFIALASLTETFMEVTTTRVLMIVLLGLSLIPCYIWSSSRKPRQNDGHSAR